MPASVASAALSSDVNQEELLRTLLTVSLTGIILLRPLYAEADPAAITDFAWVQLNPAAQQMLQLPECPAESFLTLFPTAVEAGVFGFYRNAFHSGQAERRENLYQADGIDGYYRLAALRQGPVLVVSFTDTNEQPRTAVEDALRASQTAEHAAHAAAAAARQEADAAHADLANVFTQAPAMICIFEGPAHTFQFVNPPYQALVGARPLLGRPIAEAMPELAGQPIFGLLDHVYQTGEPFAASEMLVQLDHDNQGRSELEKRYYNFIYKARRNRQGTIDGILVFAYEVTAQVLAREQVQALNEELAAINEELRATNEEYLLANTALNETQLLLRQFNHELEERVQARTRELAEQQGLLSQILGQVPAAVATLSGPAHRFTFFNEQYQALNAQRSVLGAPLAEVVPEATAHGFVELLDQVYRTGEPYVGNEMPVWLGPAAEAAEPSYYVDFRYQPLRDERGRVQGILIFAVDVTERARARRHNDTLQAEVLAAAQRQVREREAFYQVFEQTPAAVSLLRGPQFRFEYVNPAYQQVFAGRPLLGLNFGDTLPDAAAQGYLALLDRVYTTGETYFGAEIPFVSEQPGMPARTLYFNFTYQAYREQGEVVGISSFAFDVTEQVEAKRQREAQQADLTRLFEQAPMAIVVLRGPRFLIEQANANAEAIWGVAAADVLGQPHFDVIPGSAGQGFEEILTGVLHSGEAVVLHEVPIEVARAHTGLPAVGYYNVIFKPLRDKNQHVSGIAMMWTETTDQVLAREQVQNLNEELAAINEELRATNEELHTSNTQLTRTNVDLDTFVYTASHDLKAPITNIESIALALRSALPAAVQQDELVAHLLELLNQTVARFRFTIAQLTDLSKLQRVHTGPAELVNLAAALENVRLDLAPAIREAAVELTVEVAPELVVSFSPANLRSILYNLLSNSVKYRAPGRPAQVRVQAARTGQQVALAVQDNGLGLSESQQQRLFGLFQRLHTHVEGTGVGLYISKRLVENGGGTIAVHSQPDVGTTFTVTLPA